jgi:hypothetical protein
MPFQKVLDQVATAARLREGPAGVAAFLRQLYRESPLATSELARRLGWPVPVAAAVRGEELAQAGLAPLSITPDFNRYASAATLGGSSTAPSYGAIVSAEITDNRSRRSQLYGIGVWPRGAQGRRTTGCSIKPLSSIRTMLQAWSWAFF